MGLWCALAAALLCLSNAKEGGLSGWSSSISVHNEIVRRRPDLARLLAGPWFMDRKGEVPEGKKGYFELPVFNYHQVCLSESAHVALREFQIGMYLKSACIF